VDVFVPCCVYRFVIGYPFWFILEESVALAPRKNQVVGGWSHTQTVCGRIAHGQRISKSNFVCASSLPSSVEGTMVASSPGTRAFADAVALRTEG
jgi:hypothetical protein